LQQNFLISASRLHLIRCHEKPPPTAIWYKAARAGRQSWSHQWHSSEQMNSRAKQIVLNFCRTCNSSSVHLHYGYVWVFQIHSHVSGITNALDIHKHIITSLKPPSKLPGQNIDKSGDIWTCSCSTYSLCPTMRLAPNMVLTWIQHPDLVSSCEAGEGDGWCCQDVLLVMWHPGHASALQTLVSPRDWPRSYASGAQKW